MRKGQKASPEQRARMSAAQTGRIVAPFSAEHRAKLSAALKRRVYGPEERARRSAARMGHVVSPEARAKIAASLTGAVVPEEQRIRIAAAQRGQVRSPETRAKMGAAKVGNDHYNRRKMVGECVYCLGHAHTFDHMIPRGRPGWDDPENVVPACQPCNTAKGKRTPEEWLDKILATAH